MIHHAGSPGKEKHPAAARCKIIHPVVLNAFGAILFHCRQ